ncbi:nucleotidyltransferase family protein [Streptomyces sp. NPDC101249]|uniref:nucleotidyltransferase family protein n=1 Tax=Streptomyces sp. NPDC101249 TaxID=3366140 RepID=UPI00382531DA
MTAEKDPSITGRPGDDVWSFVELIATHQGIDAPPDERAELIRRPDFDHGRLVEQAMRHGLLAALADLLNRHGLRRDLPARLRAPVMAALRHNEYRAHFLTTEAARLAGTLAEAGLTCAFTKGVVLQNSLYAVPGIRNFNDVDLMIAPGDREPVRAALLDAGFTAGTDFDPGTKELRPLSRGDARMYQMSPDHWPHFHRLTGDLGVPDVAVDVANSLTWHGGPWQVPMDEVMAGVVPARVTDEVTLPTLSPVDTFLFLCLHVFRESWIVRTARRKDVSLAQFVDVVRHWTLQPPGTRAEIAAAVARLGLADPIAWVCGHTDTLFGSGIVAELGLSGHARPEWLASAGAGPGQRLVWSGDIRERLRTPAPCDFTAAVAS